MGVEILKKINDKVLEYAKENSPTQITMPAYHDGAMFGYSLASEQLLEKDKEISGLEYSLTQSYGYLKTKDAKLESRDQRIKELEYALENLAEAIPKQTENADWWEDSLTSAFLTAQQLISSSQSTQ